MADSRTKSSIVDDFMDGCETMSMEEFEKHYEENYGSFTPHKVKRVHTAPNAGVGLDCPSLNRSISMNSEGSPKPGSLSPISKLNELCQQHFGWNVVYQDISPPFTVTATLTGPDFCKIFEGGKGHRSKKEARAGAARVALGWFQANLPAQSGPEVLSTDWISKLHQFVQKRDKRISFQLKTYATSPFLFKCEITLKDGHVCGPELEAQPNKSKAKQEACRVALEYLLGGLGRQSFSVLPAVWRTNDTLSTDTTIMEGLNISASETGPTATVTEGTESEEGQIEEESYAPE